MELVPAACLSDTNGDGVVNVVDLLLVLGQWGQIGLQPADVTRDGVVDVADLLQMLGEWGPCT